MSLCLLVDVPVSLSVSLLLVSFSLCLSICFARSLCLSISLSPCLSVCLSLCLRLSVCLSACVCVCLPVCLCVCLCVCICPSVSVSVSLSVCVSLCLSLSLCLSVFVCLSFSLSVRLFVYKSVSAYLFLSLSVWLCLCLSFCESLCLPPPPPPSSLSPSLPPSLTNHFHHIKNKPSLTSPCPPEASDVKTPTISQSLSTSPFQSRTSVLHQLLLIGARSHFWSGAGAGGQEHRGERPQIGTHTSNTFRVGAGPASTRDQSSPSRSVTFSLRRAGWNAWRGANGLMAPGGLFLWRSTLDGGACRPHESGCPPQLLQVAIELVPQCYRWEEKCLMSRIRNTIIRQRTRVTDIVQ